MKDQTRIGAETVNIGCRGKIGRRSFRLFGRDVPGRPENRQRAREVARGVEPFGQTEIAHQRFAAAIEQNISGLKIAMQNALAMRVLHGARDFRHQLHASGAVRCEELGAAST